MHTSSSEPEQLSLGPPIALSGPADPNHFRSAPCGLPRYPSPAGGVPVVVGEASLSLRQLAPTRGHLGFAWTSAWPLASALFRLVRLRRAPPRGGRPALC